LASLPRIPGLSTGEQIIRSYDGLVIFVFCGKNGELGWFVTEKLCRRYTYPDRPVHTQEDAVAYCESLSGMNVWGDINFGLVFEARTSFSHALVDEHVFSTWNAGRVVCVGDGVVKVPRFCSLSLLSSLRTLAPPRAWFECGYTKWMLCHCADKPNSGFGASLGMECAAALTNKLHALLSSTKPKSKPSKAAIETLLADYTLSQHGRARMIGFESYGAIRIHSRDGWFNALLSGFVLRSETLAVFWTTVIMNGGRKLDFRDVPKRGMDKGDSKKQGQWWKNMRSVILVVSVAMVLLALVI
jgi:FAD dependent monooxygenase